MPSLQNRPYVGTWQHNLRQVIRHTPDAMVFVNGDLALPGCERCHGRIDIQRFVTGISVDAGTLPGALSASLTMSIPKISGDQIFRDGYNKLYPGQEIHIYMRGFFPTTGYFGATPEESVPSEFLREGQKIEWGKMPTYPYYPVFHGVSTSVKHDYSSGEYHASITCASLLHFWQYHNMSTNASYFGARPDNSTMRMSMMGNNFNNMHPFSMIYTLYRDVQGAAGGVAYAHREQSNIDAPLDSTRKTGGESIWSFVQNYWDQRFRSRVQNLRMYGVNGNLFNAAQQAFLGTRNHGDFQKLLKNAQFAEDGTYRSTRDPFSGDLAVAKALGFDRSGFDLIFAPNLNPDKRDPESGELYRADEANPPASLNLVDMYAFTQQSTDMGTTNNYESTYETKLQLAEAVMEVTGYEFYQDVDGDLVFKPPFYNLDTSSNRIYVIEDIDIISISTDQTEPQATWIQVKPTYFKGSQGFVANSEALNRRAVYVDWKLVAQFGWRPANIEITYTTDVRAAFLVGMARLDLLNIGVNSASVSIPIRPEMRPGIPVYIRCIDSFYYVNQLSHAFQFGSQCTTNLQLTCRRRKFFAPGYPTSPTSGQNINDIIFLNRPDLPPRPITIHDSGLPRLAGFPNVVLALDPQRMNPKFLSVGAGLPHLQSTEDVALFFNLLREDMKSMEHPVFQEVPASQGHDPNTAPAESTQYRIQFGEDEFLVFSINDLAASFNDLQNARKEVDRIKKKIEANRTKLFVATQAATSFQSRSPALSDNATFAAFQQELVVAEATLVNVVSNDERNQRVNGGGDLILSEEGVPNGNLFAFVIEIADKARGEPARRRIDGIPGSDVAASQLDQLENLKSSYTANGLPGYYRYYSASHPNPVMQGQDAVFLHSRPRQKKAVPTTGTGGGATPSSPTPKIPPPETDFNIDKVDTDGLSQAAALQAKLKAQGVEFVRASWLLHWRDDGPDGKWLRKHPGVTPDQVKAMPLTEEISDNLANVSTAGQELVNRVSANPGFKAFQDQGGKLVVSSAWRPDPSFVESAKETSQHHYGKALDIPPFPQRNQFSGRPDDKGRKNGLIPRANKAEELAAERIWDDAFRAQLDEAQKMFQEGLIGGLGFYPRGGFVHIDIRDRPEAWTQWLDAPDGRYVFPRSACGISVNEGQVSTDPRSTKNQALCEWNAKIYQGTGFEGWSEIDQQRRNRITPFPEQGKKEAGPKVGEPPPPEPEPVPPPPPEPPPELTGAPITLIPIDLPNPRKVVGFVNPTNTDPELRAPEADVGEVTATKGLIIAKGPTGAPAIVSTDLIQTVQFTQFRSLTETSISGDTPNGGEYAFRRKEFKKRLAQRFFNTAQETDPTPDSTPGDLFKELWDMISADLSSNPPAGPDAAIPIPVYDPENPSIPPDLDIHDEIYLSAGIKQFSEAVFSAFTVTGNSEEDQDDLDDIFEDAGFDPNATLPPEENNEPLFLPSVPEVDKFGQPVQRDLIATRVRPPTLTKENRISLIPLSILKSAPQFAPPSSVTKQGKKGQNLNATLRKLADAYAEAIAGDFERVFDGLQKLAMDPGKGREARLANLMQQIDAAANSALDDDDFKSTEKGRRTIKVEKFATHGSPIHTPVLPVSDAGGYEHFGSYRYGRGLTIEKGGTFAWLHNDDDPFGRLSAQAAEELVGVLSLIKQGKFQANADFQKSVQSALVQKIDEIREEENNLRQQQEETPEFKYGLGDARPREPTDLEIESRAQLRLALSIMMQTQTGQAAVNELLTTNPVSDGSAEVIDIKADPAINATQLEIKFSNFAASYTKSGPFKTSVSNAAYRLVDLTNHLQHPDLKACACKGSSADVALLAFGRIQFSPVEGINPEDQPAEAFVAEQMLTASVDFFYQQKALRGEVLNPNQTPDAASFEGVKRLIGTSLSNARTGFTSIGEQFSNVPEQFRNIRNGEG